MPTAAHRAGSVADGLRSLPDGHATAAKNAVRSGSGRERHVLVFLRARSQVAAGVRFTRKMESAECGAGQADQDDLHVAAVGAESSLVLLAAVVVLPVSSLSALRSETIWATSRKIDLILKGKYPPLSSPLNQYAYRPVLLLLFAGGVRLFGY